MFIECFGHKFSSLIICSAFNLEDDEPLSLLLGHVADDNGEITINRTNETQILRRIDDEEAIIVCIAS